jgi:hypothetical protein
MTYLIIRQRTYSDGSKIFSVQDHTEDKTMADNKVKGYNLANSEFDVDFIKVELPLILKDPITVKRDKHFEYEQLELSL